MLKIFCPDTGQGQFNPIQCILSTSVGHALSYMILQDPLLCLGEEGTTENLKNLVLMI